MSANVWFEEVDTALIKEILNTIKVKNSSGILVPLDSEKGVIIRKPEEDLKFEVYPCVSIYNLYYVHDKLRYNPNPVVVSKDESQKLVLLEDPAKPFNLFYQIELWAKYQDDMNIMTRTWMSTHFRQFNLDVTDDGGVKRSCNALMSSQPVKSDLMDKNDRIFHTIISYSIWVELDEQTRYNVNMVTERAIETKTE